MTYCKQCGSRFNPAVDLQYWKTSLCLICRLAKEFARFGVKYPRGVTR